jgi:hypothetical protein
MFKQLVAGLLLLCFTTQTFSRAAIVGSYYVNTAGYAKDCINKAKPQLRCNGHCQLMKKLKQEEKKETQDPERRNSKTQVLSSKSFFASVQAPWLISAAGHAEMNYSLPSGYRQDFFHPPGF